MKQACLHVEKTIEDLRICI